MLQYLLGQLPGVDKVTDADGRSVWG